MANARSSATTCSSKRSASARNRSGEARNGRRAQSAASAYRSARRDRRLRVLTLGAVAFATVAASAAVVDDPVIVVQTIATAPGSKTMGIDTTTHKLYVAAAKPLGAGGQGNDPDSFHVLIYGQL